MTNDFVVAIGIDDATLHVGRADDLVNHFLSPRSRAADGSEMGTHRVDVYRGSRKLGRESVAFFDENGRRLAPRRTSGGAEFVVEGRLAIPAIEPGLLLDRINTALDHMQEVLDEHPELGDETSVIGEDHHPRRHTVVPHPVGSVTEVLGALTGLFFPSEPPDGSMHPTHRGGWFHNLAHAAGII